MGFTLGVTHDFLFLKELILVNLKQGVGGL